MSRRNRSPIELASDIGAKAFDLHCYGDDVARSALNEVGRVNPEMLAWLRDRLLDITQQRPIPSAADRYIEPMIPNRERD